MGWSSVADVAGIAWGNDDDEMLSRAVSRTSAASRIRRRGGLGRGSHILPGLADRREADLGVASVGERIAQVGVQAGRGLALGEDTLGDRRRDRAGIAASAQTRRRV